uniref:L1 transposable element RRM domain-containing protein n=1 Tax=Seriola dumerili TaxID=41447 RepID=A0A3B4VAQ2_SERDU
MEGSSLTKLDGSLQIVSSNEDDITDLVKRVKALEKENTDLKLWAEDAENRSRRSNLRFIGIPERAKARDIVGFMRHLIPQLLGEVNFFTPPVIERCHRSGVQDNSRAKSPRPILVKFHYFQDKLKIMKLSREKKEPLQYKGVRVSIYLDFSAGLVQRRRGFDAVKKKLRDQDFKYAMIYPCTLRVAHAGKTQFFHTPDEVERFLGELTSIDSSIDSDMTILLLQNHHSN